ncbi:hypothetical protein M422DRAFT_252132 [Sphaerobolus stellatus SS14]|uniref:Uncharacterized protein n=1 Tax=Sphaerobolus stellatus (strain SS14) TaxID=990650 RepID=A0A0C9VQE4_SPHS4|nr:hypothetical protein M422DRAFT_252132 [Sphaerobolus stellatus SS14]
MPYSLEEFYTSLNLREVKEYRSWAFPLDITNSKHSPYFSFENMDSWVQPNVFRLFEEHASDAIDQLHRAIGDEPIHSLKAYRDFIIPAAMGSHPFFSLEHIEKWVKPTPYATFKIHVYTETESNTRNARQPVTPTRRLVKEEEKSSGLGWYMEFSSPSLRVKSGSGNAGSPFVLETDSESGTPVLGTKRKSDYSSSSEPSSYSGLDMPLSHRAAPKRPRFKSEVTEPSKIWEIPRDDAGFLLDLTGKEHLLQGPDGEKHDYDSWGGSTGRATGNTTVEGVFGPGKHVTCRVTLHCNGTKVCEYLDNQWEKMERYEVNEEQQQKLIKANEDQRTQEAESPEASLARFYYLVKDAKCKHETCDGHPVLKRRSEGPSCEGKQYFIGCSNWKLSEKWKHLRMSGKPIPFRYSSTPPPKETARDRRDCYEKSRGKLVEPLDKEPRKKQTPQSDVPTMSSTITMAKIREVNTSEEEHIQAEIDNKQLQSRTSTPVPGPSCDKGK